MCDIISVGLIKLSLMRNHTTTSQTRVKLKPGSMIFLLSAAMVFLFWNSSTLFGQPEHEELKGLIVEEVPGPMCDDLNFRATKGIRTKYIEVAWNRIDGLECAKLFRRKKNSGQAWDCIKSFEKGDNCIYYDNEVEQNKEYEYKFEGEVRRNGKLEKMTEKDFGYLQPPIAVGEEILSPHVVRLFWEPIYPEPYYYRVEIYRATPGDASHVEAITEIPGQPEVSDKVFKTRHFVHLKKDVYSVPYYWRVRAEYFDNSVSDFTPLRLINKDVSLMENLEFYKWERSGTGQSDEKPAMKKRSWPDAYAYLSICGEPGGNGLATPKMAHPKNDFHISESAQKNAQRIIDGLELYLSKSINNRKSNSVEISIELCSDFQIEILKFVIVDDSGRVLAPANDGSFQLQGCNVIWKGSSPELGLPGRKFYYIVSFIRKGELYPDMTGLVDFSK